MDRVSTRGGSTRGVQLDPSREKRRPPLSLSLSLSLSSTPFAAKSTKMSLFSLFEPIYLSSFEPYSIPSKSAKLSSRRHRRPTIQRRKAIETQRIRAFPLSFSNRRRTRQPSLAKIGDFSKRRNRFLSPLPLSFSRIYSNFLRAVYTKFPNL